MRDSGQGQTEVEEARGVAALCRGLATGINLRYSVINYRSSYRQPASTDEGRKRRKQNIGMASSSGLGLHRVTEASRVAGSGHVKTPSYVQMQLQRQRSRLLQTCLVCFALRRLQSRGIAAKLSGSTAARREQEREKRQAKAAQIQKWRSWFRALKTLLSQCCCIGERALGFMLRFASQSSTREMGVVWWRRGGGFAVEATSGPVALKWSDVDAGKCIVLRSIPHPHIQLPSSRPGIPPVEAHSAEGSILHPCALCWRRREAAAKRFVPGTVAVLTRLSLGSAICDSGCVI